MSTRTLKEITVATEPTVTAMNNDCFSIYFRVREVVRVGRNTYAPEFTSVTLLCKGKDRAKEYSELFPKGRPILELTGPESRKRTLVGGEWTMDSDQPDPSIRGWFNEVRYRFPMRTFAQAVIAWHGDNTVDQRTVTAASKPSETAESAVSTGKDDLF